MARRGGRAPTLPEGGSMTDNQQSFYEIQLNTHHLLLAFIGALVVGVAVFYSSPETQDTEHETRVTNTATPKGGVHLVFVAILSYSFYPGYSTHK